MPAEVNLILRHVSLHLTQGSDMFEKIDAVSRRQCLRHCRCKRCSMVRVNRRLIGGCGVVAEPCTLDAGSELFAEVDVLESLPLSSSWAHEMSTPAALATSSNTRSMSSIEGSIEWVGAEEVVVCRLTCGAMSSQSISTLVHAMSGSQPSPPPSPRFAPPALNAS